MAGTLYVCATPIGNLEDITFRVLETLKRVDLIAAEDTRNSIHLLNHFEIKTPMTAYHEYNKYDKAKSLVQMLLDGKDIAIITDAGTPCISDPGEELVRQAAEAGITVTSLPGPAACITALTISALPTRRFAFEAFLPTEKADKKERARILEELKSETRTMIVYEAPHHLKETLADLASSLALTAAFLSAGSLRRSMRRSSGRRSATRLQNMKRRSRAGSTCLSSKARIRLRSRLKPKPPGMRCRLPITCSTTWTKACRKRML